MAYPFGICGILLTMWLLRVLFRVNVDDEARKHDATLESRHVAYPHHQYSRRKPESQQYGDSGCAHSQQRQNHLLAVKTGGFADGTLAHDADSVRGLAALVGLPADLHNAQLVIGRGGHLVVDTRYGFTRVERVVVTNEKVLGKKIRDLHFKERYDVVISRLNRAGVELVASSDAGLQFGDILNLVGRPSAIEAVANEVGNAQHKLQQVQMLPVFIGIGLGGVTGLRAGFCAGFSGRAEVRSGGWPADYGADPRAYWQRWQAVLVYAAERQPWRYVSWGLCCFWRWLG